MPRCPSAPSVLLASLLTLNFNLAALAEKHSLSPDQLLAFAEDPEISQRLKALKRFRNLADSLAHADDRRKAAATLIEVIDAATDPETKRKAATTLLRHPPSPVTPPRPAATRAAHAPHERTARESPLNHGPIIDPLTPGSRDTSTPGSRDTPTPSTRPDADPELLLAHLARAFNPLTGDPTVALAHLKQVLADDATINRRPVPKDRDQFDLLAGSRADRDRDPADPREQQRLRNHSPLRPLRDAIALIPTDSAPGEFTHQHNFLALHPDGDTDHIHFALAQLKPNRWRITSISTRPAARRSDSG